MLINITKNSLWKKPEQKLESEPNLHIFQKDWTGERANVLWTKPRFCSIWVSFLFGASNNLLNKTLTWPVSSEKVPRETCCRSWEISLMAPLSSSITSVLVPAPSHVHALIWQWFIECPACARCGHRAGSPAGAHHSLALPPGLGQRAEQWWHPDQTGRKLRISLQKELAPKPTAGKRQLWEKAQDP